MPALNSPVVAVERAVDDLRRGLPVVIQGPKSALLATSVEQEDIDQSLALLRGLVKSSPYLLITGTRARKLELVQKGTTPVRIALPVKKAAEAIEALANPLVDRVKFSGAANPIEKATPLEASALQLAKISSLLPALLAVPITAAVQQSADFSARHNLLLVKSGHIDTYPQKLAQSLEPVVMAQVPLAGAHHARVVAFRPRFGAEAHLAVLIGHPEGKTGVPVRVHSSCLTGDILQSLRCDCGTQLSEAIRTLEGKGDGILLYLSQEGRGIGIINKLRAYRLQDGGLDTVDANEEMGFDSDERHFQPAAEILKSLKVKSVRLLSNNPAKVEALQHFGVNVVERLPLVIPPGKHNKAYLATKAKRCGHVFGS